MGGDFCEWFEHEFPFSHIGVREVEEVRIEDRVFKVQEVQVDCARPPVDLSGASHERFDPE